MLKYKASITSFFIGLLGVFFVLNLGASKLPKFLSDYPNYLQKTKLWAFIQEVKSENSALQEEQLIALFNQVNWKKKPVSKPKSTLKSKGTTKARSKTKKSTLISWSNYRAAYLTEHRIQKGIKFYLKNRLLIEKIAKTYNVSSYVIVAIMGIETNYGSFQGKVRVLDTLANLSFNNFYRQSFFKRELKAFLSLLDKGVDISKIYGSSAGAFGMSQFMPSSYFSFAQDYDEDGFSDIVNSTKDALASIAYYFQKHGWKPNEPVATNIPDRHEYHSISVNSAKIKPTNSVSKLRQTVKEIPQDIPYSVNGHVVRLPEKELPDYWVTYHNFYVITRYNHSLRYAMAVFQLAGIIEKSISNSIQYVVKRGDSLWKIAGQFNMSLTQLMRLNSDIKDINTIYMGQKIWVYSR